MSIIGNYVILKEIYILAIDLTINVFISGRASFEVDLMAYDQNLEEQFECTAEVSLGQNSKSVSDDTTSENLNGYFDCNICLDTACDPVVTLCGHLYCWPCIYKWLRAVRSSLDSDKQPDCPVCKARISETSLVPLYGRGDRHSDPDAKQPHLNLPLPRRPPGVRAEMIPEEQSQSSPFEPRQQPFHPQQYFSHPLANYAPLPPNFVTAGMTRPTVGMFGEMVYARIFGSSDTSLFSYPHASYYPLLHNSSPNPRLRRQELQVNKSLSRVSMFLFCCLILCLILF